jgi:phthalate 4,5-dioxygenase
VRTEGGMCIGAARKPPQDREYWRVTQHLMPFHTMTGPYGEDPLRNWRAWVPIDDTNCFVIGLSFHPLRPLTAEERDFHDKRASVWTISPGNRQPQSSQPFGRWRPIPALSNDFFIDRQMQRRETYSGIAEFWAQDAALREKGVVPGELNNPASYAVRSDAVLIPADTSWLEATAERRSVLAGVNPDCA